MLLWSTASLMMKVSIHVIHRCRYKKARLIVRQTETHHSYLMYHPAEDQSFTISYCVPHSDPRLAPSPSTSYEPRLKTIASTMEKITMMRKCKYSRISIYYKVTANFASMSRLGVDPENGGISRLAAYRDCEKK